MDLWLEDLSNKCDADSALGKPTKTQMDYLCKIQVDKWARLHKPVYSSACVTNPALGDPSLDNLANTELQGGAPKLRTVALRVHRTICVSSSTERNSAIFGFIKSLGDMLQRTPKTIATQYAVHDPSA